MKIHSKWPALHLHSLILLQLQDLKKDCPPLIWVLLMWIHLRFKDMLWNTVKSEDAAMCTRSSHRLCVFSGRVPHLQHEVDYDTWCSGADLIMKDPSISDIQRSCLILDSLLPPAADIVKHVSLDQPPDIYINQLDSAYGK